MTTKTSKKFSKMGEIVNYVPLIVPLLLRKTYQFRKRPKKGLKSYSWITLINLIFVFVHHVFAWAESTLRSVPRTIYTFLKFLVKTVEG